MTDEPIDFSALDPEGDRDKYEKAIRRITASAAPILAQRRLHGSIWWQISQWKVPVTAMGLGVILLVVGVTRIDSSSATVEPSTDSVALALGVPSEWIGSDSTLTTAQVLYQGDGQ